MMLGIQVVLGYQNWGINGDQSSQLAFSFGFVPAVLRARENLGRVPGDTDPFWKRNGPTSGILEIEV